MALLQTVIHRRYRSKPARTQPYITFDRYGPPLQSDLSTASLRPDWHQRLDTARSTSLRAGLMAATGLAPTQRAIVVGIRDSRIATIRQQTQVGVLGTNGFFDCRSGKAAGRSSILLPLLQRSL